MIKYQWASMTNLSRDLILNKIPPEKIAFGLKHLLF